ncbi:MAG: insulinase family protein [Treponema sp.]|nr:insulinase family protein [Treponema sp.]
MKNKMAAALFSLCLLFWALFASCKKSAALYPEYFQLDNGLSVFVKEDHKVPLAYIEIAVRAGGVTQRRDNTGIFHLYEHMMFKGNSLCKDSAAFQKALSELGVDDWNGTTGEHCVNYFFTIPSEDLRRGMEFWSAAIREPSLNEDEFEDEKKVVISEIQANLNSPGTILSAFFNKTFFPNAPWQLDPSGAVATVQNASLDELKSIKEKYYVPNNAALFIGGDVDAKEVRRLAQEIFGDWRRGSFDFDSECAVQTQEPFDQTRYFVMPNEQVSPQIAQVMVYYRGPDADFDRESTYPLDLFTDYINDPSSIYAKELCDDKELKVISGDYVGGGYSTRRRTGLIHFYATVLEPETALPSRVKKFYEDISQNIIKDFSEEKKVIGIKKLLEMEKSRSDRQIIAAENFQSLLSDAQGWWTLCDKDYYYSYEKKKDAVTDSQIAAALKKYVVGKNAFVVTIVNPTVYKNLKEEFDQLSFEEVKKENAFWFNSGNKEDVE